MRTLLISLFSSCMLLGFGCNIMVLVPNCLAEEPQGTLMMIGGADRDQNQLLWGEFARLAGGPGATVAIFPTASSYPLRTGELFAKQMKELGLKPFIVPASLRIPNVDGQQVVHDPAWVERVREASAVFLAGGEQARYRQLLVDADDKPTPLLQAIQEKYQQGGLVAGTSAGMAIMSRLMFIDGEVMLNILKVGARQGKEIDRGLGLLPESIFVDQHFLERGRFGRTLVAMQHYGFPYGIGVDEDSAAIFHRGRVRVVGYRGALILDATNASQEAQGTKFTWKKVRLSFLSHGDEWNMHTAETQVAAEKGEQFKIDPKVKGFQPTYLIPQFCNDIFANSVLLDVMCKLVDSPFDEAIGLSYDGREACQGTTDGFHFRFYRGNDTLSWDAPTAIGDPNTVLNVYLDVRPIQIQGPLWKDP